jgi:catechol 2,3-dioxygenase-like lactoylglutathione lyase family enzyme
MPIQLNHTIVHSRDPRAAAEFLTAILGRPAPTRFAAFHVVELDNGVSLDFLQHDQPEPQHYAFMVDEAEFDAAFGRIRARGLDYWADPGRQEAGRINHRDGGRGVYFADPSGHYLELITRPYGSGA